MANDRIMQAIGTLERAVGLLEEDVARMAAAPLAEDGRGSVRAALRSLDELIASLKDTSHG